MEWVSIATRLLLAGVFAVAAIAKLLDQAGVRETLRAFLVPAPLVPVAAVALPLAEALVAALLLFTPTARIGALAAVALLSVFSAGIVSALRRGERPDCHCFGQATSTPVGRDTLVRNAALIGVGIAGAAISPPALPGWLGERNAAELAALALGALSVALAAIALSSRGTQRALELEVERLRRSARSGLEAGTRVPDVRLTDLSRGESLSTLQLVDGDRAVLVFLSSDCEACERLMPSLSRWQRSLAGQLRLLAIGVGDREEYRKLAEQHDLERVLIEAEDGVASAFKLDVTPSAVLLGPGALVDGETAEGLQGVESLIRRALQIPSQV